MTSGCSSRASARPSLPFSAWPTTWMPGIARERGGDPLAHEREVVDQEDVDLHAATSVAVVPGSGTVSVTQRAGARRRARASRCRRRAAMRAVRCCGAGRRRRASCRGRSRRRRPRCDDHRDVVGDLARTTARRRPRACLRDVGERLAGGRGERVDDGCGQRRRAVGPDDEADARVAGEHARVGGDRGERRAQVARRRARPRRRRRRAARRRRGRRRAAACAASGVVGVAAGGDVLERAAGRGRAARRAPRPARPRRRARRRVGRWSGRRRGALRSALVLGLPCRTPRKSARSARRTSACRTDLRVRGQSLKRLEVGDEVGHLGVRQAQRGDGGALVIELDHLASGP